MAVQIADTCGRSWLERLERSMHQARLDPIEAFHRVPPDMRQANCTDYDPVFFTFGPCHAKFKARPPASCDLLKVKIAEVLTSQDSFKQLRCAIERRDGDIRKIYEEFLWELDFDIEPEVFSYLLALDALTIVAGALYPSKLGPNGLGPATWNDAWLLEQQLPLFILEAAIENLAIPPDTEDLLQLLDPPTATSSPEYRELYRTAAVEKPNSSPLYVRAVVKFYAVGWGYPFKFLVKQWKWQDPLNHEQSMLSHIYHTFLTMEPIAEGAAQGVGNAQRGGQKSERHASSSQLFQYRLPSASELRLCGIRFEASYAGGFTGIKFDAAKRVVTLPKIWVFDETKTYLLNLLAQEVLINGPVNRRVITSYILMMSCLIDTEEDVKLLVDAKVIHNVLGSHEELAKMWNSLGVNLPAVYTENDEMVLRCVSKASSQRTCGQYWRTCCGKFSPPQISLAFSM